MNEAKLRRLVEELEKHRHGATCQVLAEALEESERTVRRGIQAINELSETLDGRLCVQRELRDRRAFFVLQRVDMPVNALLRQYTALYGAVSQLSSLRAPIFEAQARRTLAPIEEQIRPSQLRQAQRSFYYHPTGPKDYRGKEDVVEACFQATLARKALELVYRNPDSGEEKAYLFEPWCLVMYRDGLYMHGQRHPYRRRTLALDRLVSATLREDLDVHVPADFDPQAFFGDSFSIFTYDNHEPVDIVLAFDHEVLTWVRERSWPGGAQWRERDDGRHEMTLHVHPCPAFESWILSWGPRVEVLQPALLRQSIHDFHARSLARYAHGA